MLIELRQALVSYQDHHMLLHFLAGDYAMANLSLTRDQLRLIPFIQAGHQSPSSPPDALVGVRARAHILESAARAHASRHQQHVRMLGGDALVSVPLGRPL